METTLREILGDNYDGAIVGKMQKSGKKGSGSSQTNAEGETTNFEESEIAILLEFVEDNYKYLYGHGTGTEIKAKRDKKWKEFVEAVNKVYKYVFGKNLYFSTVQGRSMLEFCVKYMHLLSLLQGQEESNQNTNLQQS